MAMQTDPVCGMKVDDQKAPAHSTYEGQTYYFCGAACKGQWDANPQKYAPKKAEV